MVEAIRNLLNQSDKAVLDIKEKLNEEKDKNLSGLQEQLPNQETISSQMRSGVCSLKTANAIDKNYNNFKDILNFLKNKINEGIAKLESINGKIEKVREWLNKIRDLILNFLTPIINILEKFITKKKINMLWRNSY